MKKLILSGFILMLALCVLGCAVAVDIVSDTHGNPDDVETSISDEPDETSETEEVFEYDTVLCYIVEYDPETAVLSYDQLEWIDLTDTARIEELELDPEYDFPNGFYLYNEIESVLAMKVSDTVKVYLVNLTDSLDPFITDMDGLAERLEQYQAPFHLKTRGDVIYIIEEQFIP